MTTLRLITAPTLEPVSIETMRAFLRVDSNTEDVVIAGLISASRAKGEELSRRAWLTQTWEQTFDAWPASKQLVVWRPPLQSVVSVKYYDESNVEHLWTDYTLDLRVEPGRVLFNTLPEDSLLESDGIVVRFIAGYGNTPPLVPTQLTDAVIALVSRWYEHRESRDVPDEIRDVLMNERAVWF